MNCETFQKLVSRALDDALPDDFAQDFHEHREVCVACQEEWRAHSAVRVFLHTLEPGSESCGSLWPVVKSELTARRARDAWFEEMDNFARRLLPVAAVLLLLLGFFAARNVMRRLSPPPEIEVVFSESPPGLAVAAGEDVLDALLDEAIDSGPNP